MKLCRICKNEVGYINGDVCIACNDHMIAYGDPEEQTCEASAIDPWQYVHEMEGGSRCGYLVTTKSGIRGRTYHDEVAINGKIIVHTANGKLLCDPTTITRNGYID